MIELAFLLNLMYLEQYKNSHFDMFLFLEVRNSSVKLQMDSIVFGTFMLKHINIQDI